MGIKYDDIEKQCVFKGGCDGQHLLIPRNEHAPHTRATIDARTGGGVHI